MHLGQVSHAAASPPEPNNSRALSFWVTRLFKLDADILAFSADFGAANNGHLSSMRRTGRGGVVLPRPTARRPTYTRSDVSLYRDES